jgi:hypothetical protein
MPRASCTNLKKDAHSYGREAMRLMKFWGERRRRVHKGRGGHWVTYEQCCALAGFALRDEVVARARATTWSGEAGQLAGNGGRRT